MECDIEDSGREDNNDFNSTSRYVAAPQEPGEHVIPQGQLPEPATLSDLQNADLTILVLADSTMVEKLFPSWKGEIEHWPISSAVDSTQLIRQRINELVVRLILKGGKRPPTPSAHQFSSSSITIRLAPDRISFALS